MSKLKSLQAAALVALTLAILYFGPFHPAVIRAQLHATPEVIRTTGLKLPAEYAGAPIGRYTPGDPYWKVAESNDWLLLNGPRGTEICHQVLDDFSEAYASEESMTPDAIRQIAFDYKDKTISLQVFVPRFKAAPVHLDECPALRYDAATGSLTRANKRIAFLSPSQPLVGSNPANK